MVLEDKNITPFFEWIAGGLYLFGLVVLALVLAGLFMGYMVSASRYGPGRAFIQVTAAISTAIKELLEVSPRRIWAMTTLAMMSSTGPHKKITRSFNSLE